MVENNQKLLKSKTPEKDAQQHNRLDLRKFVMINAEKSSKAFIRVAYNSQLKDRKIWKK